MIETDWFSAAVIVDSIEALSESELETAPREPTCVFIVVAMDQ